MDFRPNVTPIDVIKKGAFGGTYLSIRPGKDAGGCHCCHCSTPKWFTLISRVELSFLKML